MRSNAFVDFGYRVNDTAAMYMVTGLDEALGVESLMTFLAGEATQILQRDADRRFDTEGSSDGDPWKPLAQSTKKIRKELGFPPSPINYRAGDLRDFITHSQGEPVPLGMSMASLQWPGQLPPRNSDLFHSYETAQFGRKAEIDGDVLIQGDTPPRPVIGMSAQAWGETQTAFTAHMLKFI